MITYLALKQKGTEYNTLYCVNAKRFYQPDMKSNGEWGGEYFAVKSSSQWDANYALWKAFSKDRSGYFHTEKTATHPHELMWYNPVAINIEKILVTNVDPANYIMLNYEIHACNDGSSWEKVHTGKNLNVYAGQTWEIDLPSGLTYKYWKIKTIDSWGSNTNYVTVKHIELQTPEETFLLAYNTRFVQPTLSSNGTLGGSSFAVASSPRGSTTDTKNKEAWGAFDGDDTTYFRGNDRTAWITFYNPQPLVVKSIEILPFFKGHEYVQISGSNNNSDWDPLFEKNYGSSATVSKYETALNTAKAYKYYKITFRSTADYAHMASININAFYS